MGVEQGMNPDQESNNVPVENEASTDQTEGVVKEFRNDPSVSDKELAAMLRKIASTTAPETWQTKEQDR